MLESEVGRSAPGLLEELLQRQSYSRAFAQRLIEVAAGRSGEPWEIRRLAVLMLEHQVLLISAEDLGELDVLVSRLGLKPRLGLEVRLNESVLKEGYSTTELGGFAAEFQARLGRLRRVHNRLAGMRTSRRALRDFLAASRRECKLTLTRYLFTPDEVVARILDQVRTSKGESDVWGHLHECAEDEPDKVLDRMPEYERAILGKLRGSRIYWVSPATPSEINSLVEYPTGTVVLVVRPPGSDIEFEFKRAGLRGDHPLSVIYASNGYLVPGAHRLNGGSMTEPLKWEWGAAAFFSVLYRRVHGEEAEFCTTHSVLATATVPLGDHEVSIVKYFKKKRFFGRGFKKMRKAMKKGTEAFDNEKGEGPEKNLGLTRRFLSRVRPGQAIQSGTSSLRLEKLAGYLTGAEPGPEFPTGSRRKDPDGEDARRMADEVLDEILGVLTPPDIRYRSHRQYLAAVFSVPANRARADRNHRRLMGQLGKVWGTLLAARGYSNGESFVGRNVDIRSFWAGGEWQVKLLFMDHDGLHLSAKRVEKYQPDVVVPAMIIDERFILGWEDGQDPEPPTAVECLERIYRVSPATAKEAREAFNVALEHAYKKTQWAMEKRPKVRLLFFGSFLRRLRDWDFLVESYLEASDNGRGEEAWKAQAEDYLRQRGYSGQLALVNLAEAKRYAAFHRRYRFLWRGPGSAGTPLPNG